MKKAWIIIIVIIVIAVLCFFGFKWVTNNNSDNDINNNSQYNSTRTLADTNLDSRNNSLNNSFQNTLINNEPVEAELYSFSTPLKDKSKNRTTNIEITCSRINETIVKAGKEFSFCDVVGKPTSDDGYKPADAFGSDGKIIQAVGGGNCQVSTTIYNAVLGVKGLKVTERHEHDRDVAYIKDGKDATVAYDYLDLKFENNNDFDVKLYASVDKKEVTVKIYKVS